LSAESVLQRLVLSSMRGAQGGPACGGVHLDTANTVANWSAHALLLLPQNGFYHWNPHHARYNDRVWISSTLEQQAQQAQQAQSCSPMAVEQGGSELQQTESACKWPLSALQQTATNCNLRRQAGTLTVRSLLPLAPRA